MNSTKIQLFHNLTNYKVGEEEDDSVASRCIIEATVQTIARDGLYHRKYAVRVTH